MRKYYLKIISEKKESILDLFDKKRGWVLAAANVIWQFIEKRGPTSQAAQERGKKQGYRSLVGVPDPVYVPLRPGQPTNPVKTN